MRHDDLVAATGGRATGDFPALMFRRIETSAVSPPPVRWVITAVAPVVFRE
jgi:hypothetical protein